MTLTRPSAQPLCLLVRRANSFFTTWLLCWEQQVNASLPSVHDLQQLPGIFSDFFFFQKQNPLYPKQHFACGTDNFWLPVYILWHPILVLYPQFLGNLSKGLSSKMSVKLPCWIPFQLNCWTKTSKFFSQRSRTFSVNRWLQAPFPLILKQQL